MGDNYVTLPVLKFSETCVYLSVLISVQINATDEENNKTKGEPSDSTIEETEDPSEVVSSDNEDSGNEFFWRFQFVRLPQC